MYQGKPALYFFHYPQCTFEEFQKATGSNKQSWYDNRYKFRKQNSVTQSGRMKAETKFIVDNPNASFEEFHAATGADKYTYIQSRAGASSFFDYHKIKNPIIFFRNRPKKQTKSEKSNIDEAVEILKSVGLNQKPLINPQPWNEVKMKVEEQTQKAQDGFVLKEEHVSLGITPDFIWYESTQMRNDLSHAVSKNMSRFEHLVKVMEARHIENQKMITDLMDQVRDLKSRNKALDEMLDRFTAPKDSHGTSI